MTALSELIGELEAKAREASRAEQEFDREVARRRAEVAEARAFAWRRVSLLRALQQEISRHEQEEEALAAGRSRLFRELGWHTTNEKREEVAERFRPVLAAIWGAARTEDGSAESVTAALEAFERWYDEARQAPFLALMQREIVELPLVEI